MTWLLVGAGGAIGSIARYALNRIIQEQTASVFPIGIFLINILGSALIGLIGGAVLSDRWSLGVDARTFLVVGVLGGFTTFSSFSLDTLTLIRAGYVGAAVANVAGQVALSLVAVWLGFRLGAHASM